MKNLKIYALANELNLDRSNAGTITIPFGTWDYGEQRLEGGRTLFFRQTLGAQGAEAIRRQIRDAVAAGEKGVPVYWGHPDVPHLAHKYPDKRAKGWITEAGTTIGSLVLFVDWLDEDATEGFGFFSPYWTGPHRETGNGEAMMDVSSLVSVALINTPNIREFRLANEPPSGESPGITDNHNQSGATAGEGEHKMDRIKLIQALGLPETATDEDILAAIEKNKAAAADAATKQEAAEAEKAKAENECKEAKEALANERSAHVGILLDCAVADGRISVAGRGAWEKRLKDDFAGGKVALANERPLKRASAVTTTPAKAGSVNLVALANERMSKNPGMTYTTAFAQVMAEHPEVK